MEWKQIMGHKIGIYVENEGSKVEHFWCRPISQRFINLSLLLGNDYIQVPGVDILFVFEEIDYLEGWWLLRLIFRELYYCLLGVDAVKQCEVFFCDFEEGLVPAME